MLAKMIDKIVSLKGTQIFTINGETYSDRPLERIRRYTPHPEALAVGGLDSIVELIRTERDNFDTPLFVLVESDERVLVFTTYISEEFERHYLYKAISDVPRFLPGWRSHEEAMIELRSMFVPSGELDYVISLLGRITSASAVKTSDNGLSQIVEARKGISLSSTVEIRPRVTLQPFRTFLEVEQPESEFLLRLDEEKGVGLFEADGGAWRIDAKRRIAAYLKGQLLEEIAKGYVVLLS